jgi:DNA-binding LacI/PurR family transcriptional regulator
MGTIRLPTLADVGKRAGVSASTASLALRGDPRIPLPTQKRVIRASKALHYRPDPLLSALVARRQGTTIRRTGANLAALVDDRWPGLPKLSWLDAFIEGMRRACTQFGYNLDILRILRDLGKPSVSERLLFSRGIRGLVILPLVDHDIRIPCRWENYAAIVLGNPPASLPISRVGSDAFCGMTITCDKLCALGYRRIGYANSLNAERRLRHEWVGALGKEYLLGRDEVTIVPPYLPEEMGSASFASWLCAKKPDVVISNDLRVLNWLRELGHKVPEQIGFAMLNRDFVEVPGVAGIRQHLDIAGATAIEQLHAMLLRGETGFPEVPREVLIHPRWVDGNTLRNPTKT